MQNSRREFGDRLRHAMIAAGYEAKDAVLVREFSARYSGKPVTLQGVRRWIQGETIPAEDKLVTLALWLKVEPHVLRWGSVPLEVREGV